MRPLLSAVVTVALLAGPVSSARAEQCARPLEKTAFDVAGLKSQLMVTALSCQSDVKANSMDKYNAFVTRYRKDLVSQERSLNNYFQRAYGRSAQKQHDDYITQLANAQSDEGIKSGSLFCMKNMSMFDEVMALKDGGELTGFATTKAPVQPMTLTNCPVAPVKMKSVKSAKK